MRSTLRRIGRLGGARIPSVVALGLAGLSVLHAEEPPDPPPLPSDLEERVEVRLIQLTILALDAEERPVRDLRPDELVVEDEGNRVEVAFLEAAGESRLPRAHARLFVIAPGGPAEPVSAEEGSPTTFLLLADPMRILARDRKRTVDSLVEFVSSSLRPTDQAAVLSTADEVRLEVPLTSDREAVASGVRAAFAAATNPRLDRDARLRGLVRRLRSCGADMSCRALAVDAYSLEARSEVRPWLRAIEGAIRFAGGLAGRKVLVAVGPGVPFDLGPEIRSAMDAASGIGSGGGAFTDDPSGSWLQSMRELVELAHERDVTLHFVAPPARGSPRGTSGADEPGGAIDSPLETSHREALREMRELASETGGTLAVADDAGSGLGRTMDLERSAYLLGYYLPKSARPKRFRDVKIRCVRERVEIVAPTSYRERPPDRDTVAGALLLGSSIEVETTAGTARRVPFRLRVEPRELGYRVKGGEARVDFGLEVTVHDPSGATLVRSYHFIRHAYDKKEWKGREVEPMEVDGWVELAPGTYELRAAVHNARAEREGRWSRRIEIRTLPTDGAAPADADR